MEVVRALHLALLICNQTLSSSSLPAVSPDSVKGSWDKASILHHPRPLLVSFQTTTLRHRPLCFERTKTAPPAGEARRKRGNRKKHKGRCAPEKKKKKTVGGEPKPTSLSPSPPTLLFLALGGTQGPGPISGAAVRCHTLRLVPWKDWRCDRSSQTERDDHALHPVGIFSNFSHGKVTGQKKNFFFF